MKKHSQWLIFNGNVMKKQSFSLIFNRSIMKKQSFSLIFFSCLLFKSIVTATTHASAMTAPCPAILQYDFVSHSTELAKINRPESIDLAVLPISIPQEITPYLLRAMRTFHNDRLAFKKQIGETPTPNEKIFTSLALLNQHDGHSLNKYMPAHLLNKWQDAILNYEAKVRALLNQNLEQENYELSKTVVEIRYHPDRTTDSTEYIHVDGGYIATLLNLAGATTLFFPNPDFRNAEDLTIDDALSTPSGQTLVLNAKARAAQISRKYGINYPGTVHSVPITQGERLLIVLRFFNVPKSR